jgi:ankyrin repeat protein
VKPNAFATRTLRQHPDLDQLKRQAKELLEAFAAGKPAAIAEVHAHYREANLATFALHHAQLVLARAYGFESWPKLKAYVNGVTTRSFTAAVRAGDVARVRQMLGLRPELANLKLSGYDDRALHHAVAEHNMEMVRVLLESGADPHAGMHLETPSGNYPSAFDFAAERGYSDFVTLFIERAPRQTETSPDPQPSFTLDMREAFRRRDEAAILAFLAQHPEVMRRAGQDGVTTLHRASALLLPRVAAWLIEHGADIDALDREGRTALDVVGGRPWDKFGKPDAAEMAMMELLLDRGAQRTARWAVATGNAEWLRTRHAQDALGNPRYAGDGLLSIAVRYGQPEILALLLDLGFDPDERNRLDLEPAQDSWGGPLQACVRGGQIEMATTLLVRGADANGHIYAAGTPTWDAYGRKDAAMVELMERHGGYLDADMVGCMGLVDKARQMLDDEATGRLHPQAIPYMMEGRPIAEILIGDGLGNVEMLQLVLPRINRPRDDPWWAGRLHRAWGDGDVAMLRLLLEHCDVARCAPTELHEIAGNWPRSKKYNPVDRLAKATAMLDAGARLDVRDEWFKSTPLGWACRYGRVELVKLYLERGADPVEADAEPWATPRAWADKMKHATVAAVLRDYARHSR